MNEMRSTEKLKGGDCVRTWTVYPNGVVNHWKNEEKLKGIR